MLTLQEVLSDAANAPGFEGAANVEVNTRSSVGQTPLHWMAVLGDHKAIRLLLEAGAAIDAQDDQGNTALLQAVLDRQGTAARELRAAGADPHLPNHAGLTAAQAAMAFGLPLEP